MIGLGPQAPRELQTPQNFLSDGRLCDANEVALGGPKTASGWGLVTRKLNHLIRGLEPSGPGPGDGVGVGVLAMEFHLPVQDEPITPAY